jgi:hypothetical protein
LCARYPAPRLTPQVAEIAKALGLATCADAVAVAALSGLAGVLGECSFAQAREIFTSAILPMASD